MKGFMENNADNGLIVRTSEQIDDVQKEQLRAALRKDLLEDTRDSRDTRTQAVIGVDDHPDRAAFTACRARERSREA